MKKKILFVINTLGRAGAETALISLLRKLDPNKYEISLYVLMDQGEMRNQIPDYVTLVNKRYCDESVLSKTGARKLRKTVLSRAFTRGTVFRLIPYLVTNLIDMIGKRRIQVDKLLWRLLSDGAVRLQEEYDLAVAYLEGGSTYYVADHVKAKKKAAFVHIDYKLAGYTRKLDLGCYDVIDRIFAVSDEVKDNYLRMYGEYKEKTKVFHNMIDQDYIIKKSKEQGGFEDDFKGIRLLTVGRLNPQKAYDVAIDALKCLNRVDVRWYVIGEGSQREFLEQKIRQSNLEDKFCLLGAKENPFPYYTQADIYVHVTRYEGKSIAIQEAQTLGCAILASDCSGNREQILNGIDGSLCELDPKKIAEAIAWLIDHKEIRRQYQQETAKKRLIYREELELLENLIQKEE